MLMLRRFALASLALALSGVAHAQTAPKGWKVDAAASAWTAEAPDHLKLVFYPAEKSSSTFVYWFEDAGERRARLYGAREVGAEKSVMSFNPEAGQFYAQSRMMEGTAKPFAVLSYGWKAKQGKQLAQIILPPGATTQSASYKAAFEQLTAAWKTGVAYAPPAG